jgi:hypothetical protein
MFPVFLWGIQATPSFRISIKKLGRQEQEISDTETTKRFTSSVLESVISG